MGLTICICFGVWGITQVMNGIYCKHDGKKCDGPCMSCDV
jgi:hypothetical protein